MKKIIIAVFLLTSMPVFAGKWHVSEVVGVYPFQDGSFAIKFRVQNEFCTDESAQKNHFVEDGVFGVTSEGSNKIYSAALVAATTGSTVEAWFDETSPKCNISRMNVKFPN